MSSKLVGVMIDGKLTVHAPHHGHGVYDTLCCLDADDPTIGHSGVVEVHGSKFVDCSECYGVWRGTVDLGLREKDFSPRIRKP